MRLCVRWLHVCAGEEKRSLRKSAFCARTLTEKRILGSDPHGKAHSARPPACRMRLLVRPTRKVRFSVTSPAQSAPFGHVAVASPAQNAPFRESDTPRVRLCVRRRLQSGAHVYAAATRFAEASTHTNPRRARFVYTFAHRGSPGPWGRDRPGQGVPASGRSRSGVAPRSLSHPGTRPSGGRPRHVPLLCQWCSPPRASSSSSPDRPRWALTCDGRRRAGHRAREGKTRPLCRRVRHALKPGPRLARPASVVLATGVRPRERLVR